MIGSMPRTLLIGSPFFGYHRHIIAALEARGHAVDFYNDRPGENPLLKGAIRLKPSLVAGVVEKYLQNILSETRTKTYDLILVINGKALTPRFVSELKKQHPGAGTVLYLWDSIQLYPHVLDFAELFDRRYTFDSVDAGGQPGFELLPLFYTHDYRTVGEDEPTSPMYDIVNVCSVHANRYQLMKHLVPDLRAADLRVYSYLYLNPVQFAYNRVRSEAFRGASAAEFKFRTLAAKDYVEVLAGSRAVLDANHVAQSGLTMRTIETLGARRKLVTTNRDVVSYDFYDPSRVLVIDPGDPDVRAIRRFIEEPQIELASSVYRKYDIDTWVETITSHGIPES